MQNLIPVNVRKEEALSVELAKTPIFGSVEQFIDSFNSGMLTSKNETVADMAELITNTYRNIVLHKSRLIIKDHEEVACENITTLFEGWRILTSLKRLAAQLVSEDYPEDTKIVFNDKLQGTPQVETFDKNHETLLIQHWACEKLIAKTELLAKNLVVRPYIHDYTDEQSCYFNVVDLVDLDTAFIIDIENTVLEKTLL